MASVYISIGAATARGTGVQVDALNGDETRTEVVTSSDTSAAGSLTANGLSVAVIFCETAVYVNSGAAPTAALATGVYVPAGLPTAIAIKDGHKVAAIDV